MTNSLDYALGLAIDGTPPSLNAIPDMGAPLRAAAAPWQARIAELLRRECLARDLVRVEASAVLTFPTRRRRVEVNYRDLLAKALADALVAGGYLDDDSPAHFAFGAITFGHGDTPETEIALRCWEGTRVSKSGWPDCAPGAGR